MNFIVEPGQTVAIVGHTGAGKTTLTSLMMRFYEVTAGEILLDGVDLRAQELTALRRHFAVVLQDPFLFAGTVADNIRLGNDAISDQRLREAARDVNVLDFIESLPRRFRRAGAGARQLALYGAEAADQLCAGAGLQSAHPDPGRGDLERGHRHGAAHSRRLERMVEGRTSVLIAHRLSTVQRAETILVMHKGQLREMGSHQELLAAPRLYWKLYQLQYKDQEAIGLSPQPSAITG